MDPEEVVKFSALAEKACRAAASILEKSTAAELAASQHDVKSIADLEADAAIRDVLTPSGLPILSEESGCGDLDSATWIVDPLDGTVNFMKGNPLNCVSIALWSDGRPVFGAIYDFKSDAMYTGGRGQGAACNGESIHGSEAVEPGSSMLATGFPSGRSYCPEDLGDFVERVGRFRKLRLLGSAALSLAWVARGWVDAYLEEDIYIWDVAAGIALVEGAGGCICIDSLDTATAKLTAAAAGTPDLLNATVKG